MYIDADVLIKAAGLLGALGVLTGAVIAVYKVVEQNRRQFGEKCTSSPTPAAC